ncbi:MAG: SLBB domain-containing protein [Sedimentisphaerales bacterium]|nr:SLBB domain-containing protein [Sedimentisphaerales bacterium]
MESWVPWPQGEAARGPDVSPSVTRRRRRVAPGSFRFGGARSSYGTVLVLLAVLVARPSLAQEAVPSFPGAGRGSMPDASQMTAAQVRDLLNASSTKQDVGVSSPSEPVEPNVEPDAAARESARASGRRDAPSAVELLLSGRAPAEVSTDLKQFGYDVFSRRVSTFAPVANVPVGPDYVIGPGDGFTVTLWGGVDAQIPLQVDRGGQVVLPEVGALKVWGMRFAELESYLQHELSRKYTNFKMSISMDRLRTITIYVVGEAAAPSSYTVSSLSTVISGLFAAGGPSKNGSLRNITLRRAGAEPNRIDLYDFLLGGDKSGDVRLQDGDTIFIPLIGPVVAIAGNVKRPAIYEMAQALTLKEALDLAGGVTFAGWLQRVQVERVQDHRTRIVADLDLAARDNPEGQAAALDTVLRDGDVVKVFAVAGPEQNVVFLDGHVLRPGKYEWKPGLRLREVLTSYSVLLPQPNTDYGEIERLVPPDLHPAIVPFSPARVLAGEDEANLPLEQFDTIRVFRWDEKTTQTVRISGMVFDPNQYRLVPDMRVTDLVDRAGGLQKNAYLRTAEITRRHISQDGMTTEKIEIDLAAALASDPEHDIFLRDYDYLVVRPIPELEFDRTAEIAGQVRFPGVYPIRQGENLSSLIDRAGGFTERAYLKGAVFTRESAREVQRRRLDEMVRQVEESVLATSEEVLSGATDAQTVEGQKASLATKQQLLARLQAAQVTGRVVIKLMPLEQFRDSAYNLKLEDGDTLTVPETPSVVYVVGEVFNPTSLLYEEGGTVNHYLRKVGGLTRDADEKQLSVVKADGSVVSKQQGNGRQGIFWDNEFNRWFFGGFTSLRLEPGDTIVAPRKLDRGLWIRNTKDITQIVFQIAVAAGVVLAI